MTHPDGSHSKAKSILRWGTLAVLLLGGLVFAGGKYAVDQTNTVEFCISCHEMKDNNFEEYKETIHAKNRTGVKAICSDCHVPHDLIGTTIRKIKASNDVLHHVLGTIDTKEKFEAHRLDLAKRVWKRMKETDSKECRQCHDTKAMDPEKQGKTAQKQHLKLASGERTCIDCHFGIAHKEPEGGHEPREALDN
ncbi:MAG TPA: NapC/NirT family cytochrome c [Azonexus sp.]|nr:NapC/NirT family cytochrome c [Azonexus sp.]